MNPAVAVVLVTWNNFDDTAECLESLRLVAHPDLLPIVVDNGSRDDSAARIRQRFPGVTLVENGSNRGLAGGNNAGIRRALECGAGFVLLLNNDTVVDPGLVAAFLAAADRHPQAGVFGARIYRHDDPRRIWWARPRWDPVRVGFDNEGSGELDDGARFEQEAEIDYANGCALFFRREVVERIGLMDERFFVYFEDVDWCFSARAAGFGIRYVPQARLWHKVARTNAGERSPIVVYFETRNQFLWSKKHLFGNERRAFRRRLLLPLVSPVLHRPHRLDLLRIRRRVAWMRSPHGRACLRGLVDYALKSFGDCPPSVRRLAASAPGAAF